MNFGPDPKARGSLKSGMVYALFGEDGWIYWAQVKSELAVGFFRFRSRSLDDAATALTSPVMLELTVAHYSIGRALRAGAWKKVGIREVGEDLQQSRPQVQWPAGEKKVHVLTGSSMFDGNSFETTLDGPKIQNLEIAAAWDAEYHIPNRVVAEYENAPEKNKFGGPVWLTRQRGR